MDMKPPQGAGSKGKPTPPCGPCGSRWAKWAVLDGPRVLRGLHPAPPTCPGPCRPRCVFAVAPRFMPRLGPSSARVSLGWTFPGPGHSCWLFPCCLNCGHSSVTRTKCLKSDGPGCGRRSSNPNAFPVCLLFAWFRKVTLDMRTWHHRPREGKCRFSFGGSGGPCQPPSGEMGLGSLTPDIAVTCVFPAG